MVKNMPIAVGGKMVSTNIEDIGKLSIKELAAVKDYLQKCLHALPDSPVIHAKIEAIKREERWRESDSWEWPHAEDS
jgi:hypothetical protein